MNNNSNNESNQSLNPISTSRSGLSQFVVGGGVNLADFMQVNPLLASGDISDMLGTRLSDFSNSISQHLSTTDQQQQNSNQSMFRTNTVNRSNAALQTSHTHTHSHSHSPNNNNSDQTMSNSQIVLDLASSSSNNLNNNNNNPSNLNNEPEVNQQLQQQDQSLEGNAANGFFMLLLKTMQSSLPFFVILIAKIFHQHLLGFFIVLGFLTTLHWSNRTLVNQVQLKEKKQNHKLMLLILFLISNVIIFFFIFKDSKLENCLIFLPTNIQKMDMWNLIWIVVCSDTIIKFLLISLKSFVTLLPFNVIPLRKRGNFYSAIENCAVCYRSLTPIHPWLLFLMYSETVALEKLLETSDPSNTLVLNDTSANKRFEVTPTSSKAFPIFLCILYIIFKLNQLYTCFNELIHSVQECLLDTTYGLPVTLNENEDNICPICQDKFKNPVILKCKHVFCQDCVCVWLDKENSCPMCRSKVSIRKPKNKDGSTTILVQWF